MCAFSRPDDLQNTSSVNALDLDYTLGISGGEGEDAARLETWHQRARLGRRHSAPAFICEPQYLPTFLLERQNTLSSLHGSMNRATAPNQPSYRQHQNHINQHNEQSTEADSQMNPDDHSVIGPSFSLNPLDEDGLRTELPASGSSFTIRNSNAFACIDSFALSTDSEEDVSQSRREELLMSTQKAARVTRVRAWEGRTLPSDHEVTMQCNRVNLDNDERFELTTRVLVGPPLRLYHANSSLGCSLCIMSSCS